MADISRAIRETNALFQRRRDPTFWAANLLEGSRSLKTALQWTHYYAWVSNPQNYNPDHKYIPMDRDEEVVYDHHPDMKPITYHNGTEAIIHFKNMGISDEDDEKKE